MFSCLHGRALPTKLSPQYLLTGKTSGWSHTSATHVRNGNSHSHFGPVLHSGAFTYSFDLVFTVTAGQQGKIYRDIFDEDTEERLQLRVYLESSS